MKKKNNDIYKTEMKHTKMYICQNNLSGLLIIDLWFIWTRQ